MEVEDDDYWKPHRQRATTTRNIARVKMDINELMNHPPPGILGYPDENDVNIMHLLLVGPKGTPYQDGMFNFIYDFTDHYPLTPPKLRCLTTCGNGMRFHPNIYSNGMVCLSIIGTFPGPGWTPSITVSTVALSILSLFNEWPFFNEPLFEDYSREDYKEEASLYNKMVRHEVIRIAVCDVYEKREKFPEHFLELIEETFEENYDDHVKFCKENLHLDGGLMQDPVVLKRSRYNFRSLLDKLESLVPSSKQRNREKHEDCVPQAKEEKCGKSKTQKHKGKKNNK